MKKVMNQEEVALYLGISQTSVKNWVRHGLLKDNNEEFDIDELAELKDKIERGEINRLNSRANKTKSKDRFIPEEYIGRKKFLDRIHDIINFVIDNKVSIDNAIFLLTLNLFIKSEDIKVKDYDNLLLFNRDNFKREGVYNHLIKMFQRNRLAIDGNEFVFKKMVNFDLPQERDILGIIYQSLIHEGEKSNLGSYYTPYEIVKDMVFDIIREDSIVLDPCCGTGQFISAFSEAIKNPKNIYGFDIDKKAVDIASSNLLLKYQDIDFTPNIFHLNTLNLSEDERKEYFNKFDLIATNPPWGAIYDKSELCEIEKYFPYIKSKESFSFFICQNFNLLKQNGILSFVLPESITNIKTHCDIRTFVLNNFEILEIKLLGKRFKKVMSPVLTMKMDKAKRCDSNILIQKKNESYLIRQDRFLKNRHNIFDVYVNGKDLNIFNKIFDRKYITLENRSDWALGIVTGDNGKYIKSEKIDDNYEPIFKGSDIMPFVLKCERTFIHFEPEKFQQVASVEFYRAKEKLIYKFISDTLIFAYDDKERLTLNSANILIPKIEDYPIKIVPAFFNSKLFNFYFQKKYNTVKILRGDIEQLPLPILSDSEKREIIGLVNGIIVENTIENNKRLNEYIYKIYLLNNDEIEYIENYL